MRGLRAVSIVALVVAVLSIAAAAVLKHRGFRASVAPGQLEANAALAVRNFAIPHAEHTRTSPIHLDDPVVIDRGRTAYQQRCATCHGSTANGATAIGANSYPRVPDLHSARTQRLTDGDLHEIIEYGVQMTGMPALPQPHASNEAWELVAYLRNLDHPVTPAQQADLAAAHYVGSAACQRCHADVYAHWQKTTMANVVRDPHQHPDAILGDLTTNKVAPFTADQVAFVYGSRWKQRYFTRIGDDLYPLPVQWDVANKKWLPYHVPDTGADWWTAHYPSANNQRPTSATCDGCHSVEVNPQTHQPVEWNVGCERCHGPGSLHAAAPTRANILNPAGMDDTAATDNCISCHSQGRPRNGIDNGLGGGKAFDWAVGYRPGLHLADFWKLEDADLGKTTFLHFADGTARKNRMQGNDYVQSTMYSHGVTCTACHDPHGSANPAQLRKPADQICLDCHSPGGANGPRAATLEQHTHHAAGSAGSQCIACHMPAIQTEGVPGAFVHAHTFRVVPPSMTDRYNMPNPCTTCHKDKTTAWAANSIQQWTTGMQWRAAN